MTEIGGPIHSFVQTVSDGKEFDYVWHIESKVFRMFVVVNSHEHQSHEHQICRRLAKVMIPSQRRWNRKVVYRNAMTFYVTFFGHISCIVYTFAYVRPLISIRSKKKLRNYFVNALCRAFHVYVLRYRTDEWMRIDLVWRYGDPWSSRRVHHEKRFCKSATWISIQVTFLWHDFLCQAKLLCN